MRAQPVACSVVVVACLSAVGTTACFEEYRSPRTLTDDPVVMAISLSVVEDGPLAADLAPLPADRPRAEVLPLDTVELDALVANVDGPLPLDDAAWVLCGNGCLPSLARQGERYGVLEACTEGSAASSFACLAGRGVRPRLVMPDVYPDALASSYASAGVFQRVAVIVGSPGGPTTDECLQQLVQGPRVDLWGCGVGVRELLYGPAWALEGLLDALGIPSFDAYVPEFLYEVLPPNTAAVIEQVRIGTPQDFYSSEIPPELEPRSIHEVLEVAAGGAIVVEPVVSVRDQQLTLQPVGPEQWFGVPEAFWYAAWSDRGARAGGIFASSFLTRFWQGIPDEEGPMRLYVTVTDSRGAISWFTLELRVVAG